MRIERLEIVPYALPFREPYVTARGRLERRELLLVRLWADDGTVGARRGGAARRCGAGRAGADRRRAGGRLPRAGRGRAVGWNRPHRPDQGLRASGGPARRPLAAIDIATLDLVGKRSACPAWQLLGATEARPVPCNATLVAGEPDGRRRDAPRVGRARLRAPSS